MTNAVPTTTGVKIEFNAQFAKAYDALENGSRNVFITGKAGTGKSTLLQYFRDHSSKNVVVLAPTGVAAVNIKGQTIHSFFRFKPDITPEGVHTIRIRRTQKTLYQKIDTIVIDEVSMVRADLLDAIDMSLKLHRADRRPFGGIQVVLFGDACQLPPVVRERELKEYFSSVYETPFFFSSKVLRHTGLHVLELTKIFRQSDPRFVSVLNRIRKALKSKPGFIRIAGRL